MPKAQLSRKLLLGLIMRFISGGRAGAEIVLGTLLRSSGVDFSSAMGSAHSSRCLLVVRGLLPAGWRIACACTHRCCPLACAAHRPCAVSLRRVERGIVLSCDHSGSHPSLVVPRLPGGEPQGPIADLVCRIRWCRDDPSSHVVHSHVRAIIRPSRFPALSIISSWRHFA